MGKMIVMINVRKINEHVYTKNITNKDINIIKKIPISTNLKS
jgi:hypothetical protein